MTETSNQPGYNSAISVFPSAARAIAQAYASDDFTNHCGQGIHIRIDATAATATPSVVFRVMGKDPASGKYYELLASAAVTGISVVELRVYPQAVAAANAAARNFLPTVFRVTATHADTDPLTYSVSASLLR